MSRLTPFALTCIVVAAALASYRGRIPAESDTMTEVSAAPARGRSASAKELQTTQRKRSESPAPEAVAEAKEVQAPGERQITTSPSDPVTGQATGAAAAWPAPEGHLTASAGAGIPPGDFAIDPVTSRVVSTRSPDYAGAPVHSGVPPADVRVDSSTGVATAR